MSTGRRSLRAIAGRVDRGHTGFVLLSRHFLAGPEAGERWLAEHVGAVVLTLEEAFELGRLVPQPFLRHASR